MTPKVGPPLLSKEERSTHIVDGSVKFAEDILQLLKNRSRSDVRIILEDGEILANKDVLSTRCEYFAAMFSNKDVKFIEEETNSVDMSHCSKVIMDKLIKFLFSGDMYLYDLSLTECSDEDKKEIMDSFDLVGGSFTAEKLLTDVRRSGLYSREEIDGSVLEIIRCSQNAVSTMEDHYAGIINYYQS